MELIVVNGVTAMDSRDIAKLTKKKHSDVCRDIRSMIEGLEIGESSFASSYKTKQNKEVICYKLPYRETIILLSGYSIDLRAAVVDRWLHLEKRQKKIHDESKKTRNQFTEMLKDHGYSKPGHYIQTTIQMKNTLGITAKKNNMTELELKKIRAAEAMADLLIDDENGYQEVNPVCVNSCQIVIENKERKEING